ncbi:sulfide/dihydroorotate dehydrogenase-like FAD/NAD-binding protein [Clostridium sp. 'White wine YQ']|uniref:sulfide/dihydroorotate dehydrogenase-like FAD/NAD-binding protein n=1 Tax=Clostridium sp. 'White wine YQ' TaxID=3027474 RepID=UPI002365F418|nr:sulfide/dihydroorotate dehydrogenase-like FAD/NAD-binding protein [Clostridium sp. 'White wine YQ']MDD7795779.1 sulfide/dihydroorotate dehydrogenase-like FAD/NAD-binding protein [Clostridium sp. 'White wine YQ']
MFKILKKRILADNLYLMDIEAPRVAKSAKPGQFVIVKLDEKGERIPLTICDYNSNANSVTIVFQTIGASTRRMAMYEEGDCFHDFLGPLGVPSELVNEKMEALKDKNIVFVAGGVGAAPVYPQVKWLNSKGVKADVIVGAKNKDILILEEEMREVAGNLYIATDDGSYGYKGLVTEVLKDLVINQGKKYDLVVAIGPMIMMKFVCMLTKELDIKTIVSLNPIMVDGTGMCGACRVTVGKEIKFACVDGPEFDGHLVNFDEALRRQTMYKTEEGRIQLKKEEGETHHANGCSCEE